MGKRRITSILSRRGWFIGALLLSTFIAWAFLLFGHDGYLAFLAWVSSMALSCLVVRSSKPTAGSLSRVDLVGLVLVTSVATVFRIFQLDMIPAGLWIDEIWTAQNAFYLKAQEGFSPFGTMSLSPRGQGGTSQCNLYLYFAWMIQAAFGSGRLGVKMLSVLPGIAAVPALFLLARQFLTKQIALSAAFLLAISSWHVTLSRWGWDEVLSTTIFVFVFSCLYRGLRDYSPRYLLFAGLLSGLSLYTYLASRLGVAAALVFLGTHLLLERGKPRRKLFSSYLLGLLLAGFPVFMIWIKDPQYFWGRMGRVSILRQAINGEWGVLFSNLSDHLLMFNFVGDQNPRHNFPGEPMLDILTGVAFAVGIVVALYSIRKIESRMCLIWLSFGLLGGILTRQAESPQAYRTGIVIPACCLLAGLALAALDGFLRKKIPAGGRVSSILIVILLIFATGINYTRYFVDRPASRRAWFASHGAVARLIGERAVECAGNGYDIYFDNKFRDDNLEYELDLQFRHEQSEKAARYVRWINVRRVPFDTSLLGTKPSVGVVIFVLPRHLKKVSPCIPDFRRENIVNPFGDTIAVILSGQQE